LGVAFNKADNILTTAAKGIAEIITVPGLVNVDFEDVNTVMKSSGVTIMCNSLAEGEDRAHKAISEALNSPLLEDNDIRGAQHILLNITSGTKEMTMDEIGEITDYVQEEAGYGTDLIWGHCTDETIGEKIAITLIATGFNEGGSRKTKTVEEKKTVSLEETFNFVDEEVSSDFGYDSKEDSNTIEFDDIPTYIHRGEQEVSNLDDISISKIAIQQKEEKKKLLEMDQTRRELLRENTSKPLDNPKSIIDMENVPAYKRRKVTLEETKKSLGNKISNYSVIDDEDGPIVKSKNSFLYDNID
jgi:cell division protein FtsZ